MAARHQSQIAVFLDDVLRQQDETPQAALRRKRLARALDDELRTLEEGSVFNATAAKGDTPYLFAVDANKVILWGPAGNEDDCDIEGVILGRLKSASVVIRRRPSQDGDESEIIGIALEHERLPSGRIDFHVRSRSIDPLLDVLGGLQ